MAGGHPYKPKDQQNPTELLTPGDIAKLRAAAAQTKDLLQGTVKAIEAERSGQLSPPHTPGRRRT